MKKQCTQMKCKRKPVPAKVRCVCGCRGETGNFFASGHDRRLESWIDSGATELTHVDWCNVPLCFFGGKHADLIKSRRPRKGCSGKWKLQPKRKGVVCQLD